MASKVPEVSDCWKAEYIYLVDVEVIRGIDLAVADVGGSSDPFVKVRCGNRQFRTNDIKKELNPKWNAKTQFYQLKKPKEVFFDVRDWDRMGKSDPLGVYAHDLTNMFQDGRGIVTLTNIAKGKIEIKIKCRPLRPLDFTKAINEFTSEIERNKQDIERRGKELFGIKQSAGKWDAEQQKLTQDCEQLTDQITAAKNKLSNLKEKDNQMQREVNGLNAEIQEKKEELMNLGQTLKQQSLGQAISASSSPRAEESNLQTEAVRYSEDIETFMTLLQQEEEDRDTEDRLSGKICMKIIENLKMAKVERDKYQKENNQLSEMDSKEDECEDAARGFQKFDKAMAKHVTALRDWKDRVDEEMEKQKDQKSFDDDEVSDREKKKEYFQYIFLSMNKFFFNLRVIGAALEHFGDEIQKEVDKKKVEKVTFEDMIGDDGAWSTIFKQDLDFIKDELVEQFNDYNMTLTVKGMHGRVQEFISDAFQGRYNTFAAEIAKQLSNEIWNDEKEEKPSEDAVVGCLITVLNFRSPKTSFVHDLYASIQDEMKDPAEDEEDEMDEQDISEGAFELALAMVVLKVVELRDLWEEDMLEADDKKQIADAREEVDMGCQTLCMKDESRKLVKEFMSTGKNGFFKPDNGGACECAGEGTFLGNLFGKICK